MIMFKELEFNKRIILIILSLTHIVLIVFFYYVVNQESCEGSGYW